MHRIQLTFLSLVFVCSCSAVYGQWRFSSESGLVFNQYNDVRAPNGDIATGSFFSFTDDFEANEPVIFLRLEAGYTFADKHTFLLTAAPLAFNYDNFNGTSIQFEGRSFESSTNLSGHYEFNTYRFSYRYALLRKEKTRLELGLTVLLRDAKISLTQDDVTRENTDLGFVPLISFLLATDLNPKLSFLLVGDALVGPQGRAEDIFAGFQFDILNDRLFGKVGYRLIEGGADVTQVYNFAFFHFFNIGIASEF
ncbi:MAG: hypothetical protein AAGI49_14345 [Bacteroidota bacterium]